MARSWDHEFFPSQCFQVVTAGVLRDAGAQYYGWVPPGTQPRTDDCPICPLGGFVFMPDNSRGLKSPLQEQQQADVGQQELHQSVNQPFNQVVSLDLDAENQRRLPAAVKQSKSMHNDVAVRVHSRDGQFRSTDAKTGVVRCKVPTLDEKPNSMPGEVQVDKFRLQELSDRARVQPNSQPYHPQQAFAASARPNDAAPLVRTHAEVPPR